MSTSGIQAEPTPTGAAQQEMDLVLPKAGWSLGLAGFYGRGTVIPRRPRPCGQMAGSGFCTSAFDPGPSLVLIPARHGRQQSHLQATGGNDRDKFNKRCCCRAVVKLPGAVSLLACFQVAAARVSFVFLDWRMGGTASFMFSKPLCWPRKNERLGGGPKQVCRQRGEARGRVREGRWKSRDLANRFIGKNSRN